MFPYEDKVLVERSPCGDPKVTLPEGSPLPTSQPGCSSGGPGEGSGAVASSERLCLPPLVLAAILSSQLRAGPGESEGCLWLGQPKGTRWCRGGLTSRSAVRNRLGKTCCRSTFALSPFPGPQRSPKEAGGVQFMVAPRPAPLSPPLLPGPAASHGSPVH